MRTNDGTGTNPTGSTQNVSRISGTRRPHNTTQSDANHNNGNNDDRPPSRRRRIDVSPCCNCSRNSTCQAPPMGNKSGCECKAAGRRCISCACLRNCRNKQSRITTATGRGSLFFSRAPPGLVSPPVLPSPSQGLRQTTATSLAEETPPTTQPPVDTPGAVTRRNAADLSAATSATSPRTDELLGTQEPPPMDSQSEDDEDDDPLSTQAPPAADDAATTEAAGGELPAQPPPVAPDPINTEPGADHPAYQLTPADELLDSVLGDHVHSNDGRHLTGGVTDDCRWQTRWQRMVQISPTRYSVPKGTVGRRFLTILTNEFRQVRERKWNSERPLVFVAVVLQTTPEVRRARDIRQRLSRRMDLWEQGCHAALVDDTEAEVGSRGTSTRAPDDETLARAFNARVLSGRLHSAVRNLTNRGGGGVLAADGVCTKTGRPVLEVLQGKHPELRDPVSVGEQDGAFEPYDATPTAIPVDITAEVVETVATKLSGAAGLGGTDAVDLRNWLLRFGRESEAFRTEMARWASWLANSSPPWAAYRAMMACRLVALDKQPGVRPVGIGEIYRRLWAKCLLKVIGTQATIACGNYNLCAGLAAGIEGAVHAVKEVWDNPVGSPPMEAEIEEEDPPLFTQPPPENAEESNPPSDGLNATLLVDAFNGFNELSRKAMLWTVKHRWANGARFAFNCYRHSVVLILRRPGKPCLIILSKEGVTQGDPLAMLLYGVALIPLAAALRAAVPTVVQPWYADDAAMSGPAIDIAPAMRLLEKLGPLRGYYPEPAKSILICDCDAEDPRLEVLEEFDFQRRDGCRYVGGFIGTDEARQEWLAPKIQKWVHGVERLAKVAKRFPQTAYAGLSKSLQMEWQYLQRVTPDTAAAFGPIEDVIAGTFLPSLLAEERPGVASLRSLLVLPVRQAGLGIPNPTATAGPCYAASKACTSHLTASLLNGSELDTNSFVADAAKSRRLLKKTREHEAQTRFLELQKAVSAGDARRMLRAKGTGAWLTAMPSTLNGTELSVDEFRDSIRMRFGLTPSSLPHRCEGCGQRFSVEHAMTCKKGGLVMLRHNDVAAEWHHLCAQALTPAAITDEPLIHMCRDVQQAGANGTAPPPELRGDIAAHGFWRRGTTTIFDVRVTDTDAPSYRGTDPQKVLRRHEKEKKDKYNALCVARRRHFTPLVFSVDGLQGTEATAASKRLASRLAAKWHRAYSEVVGYVRSRLSVALARSASRCLRADRDPPARQPQTPWESGTGLGLYQ
jgi:hypothetical protein